MSGHFLVITGQCNNVGNVNQIYYFVVLMSEENLSFYKNLNILTLKST